MIKMKNAKDTYLELNIEEEKLMVKNCYDNEFCEQLIKNDLIVNNSVNLLEGIYLIAIEKAMIDNEVGWGKALELIDRYKIPLHIFLVYYDLRKRGRRVWIGPRDNTLISETHKLKKIEVFVLSEGSPITTNKIANWSELAVADSHIPIIAIVDKNGEITYYESRIYMLNSLSNDK
ncbi:tRNA splicing endonuclease [Caldisphaera lagunensis DSM 15908]|uniref:tRNA splicing endonuclease n=2 Tax=Caldisphaera lagunensis TaxID=200415 RepID=L0ADI6_CALLD|nr:tRNA splicing endonuclease [Caldisphaera lagunensis DSM 15908]